MTVLIELALAALVVAGGLFGLIGSYGLLRLKEPMQRLHAPTKATTIGVGSALLASALNRILLEGVFSAQEVLVTIFLLVTAPLSALYLAKVHLLGMTDRSSLPDTRTGASWSTFGAGPSETDRDQA
jgi:multicomponent K+:H+ antiporter subunit G